VIGSLAPIPGRVPFLATAGISPLSFARVALPRLPALRLHTLCSLTFAAARDWGLPLVSLWAAATRLAGPRTPQHRVASVRPFLLDAIQRPVQGTLTPRLFVWSMRLPAQVGQALPPLVRDQNGRLIRFVPARAVPPCLVVRTACDISDVIGSVELGVHSAAISGCRVSE